MSSERGAGRTNLMLWLSAAGAVLLTMGCTPPARINSAHRYDVGVVYVLPGIEGRSIWNRNIAVGLDAGGVESAIEVFDWTVEFGTVYNLVNIERNMHQARQLARRIAAYRRQHPDNPVHLVGHSGGAGIGVLALEALPANVRVDMALLLAPALSPEYDLTEALRRTRHGIINFYSHRDVALLGVGTTVFGNIDRDMGAAAGSKGFTPPRWLGDRNRKLYSDKLRQVAWSPELEAIGANGTHMGWTTQEFASRYLAQAILLNSVPPIE